MRRTCAAVGALGCVLMVTGCPGPRFVSVAPDSGVVALPANTNSWPTYYRNKAEALIRQRFPQGYVIEREEEAVVGTKTSTDVHTHTTHDTGPFAAFLAGPKDEEVQVGLLGPDHVDQHTQHVTTQSHLTEWRIYVRAKPATPSTEGPILTTGGVSATPPSAPQAPPPAPTSRPSP